VQTGSSLQIAVGDAGPPRFSLRRLLGGVGRLFPRNADTEAVATVVQLAAPPDAVWRALHFYEDLPSRPLWFLRIFLPRPIRTEGAKTELGSIVRCTYDGGHLMKRITAVEPPWMVRFDVLEQDLGVEGCISLGEGSYELRATPGGTELVLTTRYRGHLRPRRLWRPFERFLGHRLHRHILDGMRAALEAAEPVLVEAALEAAEPVLVEAVPEGR
jgi:uncharacterized protein YndB with AHSA1/START domain